MKDEAPWPWLCWDAALRPVAGLLRRAFAAGEIDAVS
jgi:hypothetical protein